MANASVLIVDDDPFVLGLLVHVAETRGLSVVGVRTPEDADGALAGRAFGVAVVDLRLGAESGLELIKRLRARDPELEAIVISSDRRLSSALESFDHEVFAFLPKPLDPSHVCSTVERALERRRDAAERRRLTWELALLNEVSEIVASSLELDTVLQRAINRVAMAFGCRWAFVRLPPIGGGALSVRVATGVAPATVDEIYRTSPISLPSDRVFADGVPLRVAASEPEDEVSRLARDAGWRCSISVPITAGDERLGVVTLLSDTRDVFTDEDERIITTIGRQFGVAVANAQLYQRVHRAKVEWERTFDAISDPIAVFDSACLTMRGNAALATLCGWHITETQGRACSETGLCGGEGDRCLVARALADGREHDQEVVTGDGRIFAVTTLPVPGATAVVLFAKEVTEERRQASRLHDLSGELTATNAALTLSVERLQATQAQLVQSEKLSAIGQLVAGVAHELNNPLTSIIGYAQLVQEVLMQQGEPNAAAAGMLDDLSRVLSESDRAARIVRNLLLFARRQTSERARTDLADLCRRVVGLRTYDHQINHVDVALDLPPDLPPVYVDDGQIQQALLNLVLNAEHAIKGMQAPRLRVHIVPEPSSSALVMAVTDNGHGIEPENLSRVFDPFFTTRGVGEGTGLGLSIVYGIVRDHGGEIWATSANGETTLAIRLPARFVEPVVPPPAAIVAHGDAVTRDFVVAVFAGWGYSVRVAATAREALAQAVGGDGDVLLLDPALVERHVDDWRAVWRQVPARLKLVALDAPAVEETAAKFLREAAAVVLPPPFDLASIRGATLAASRTAI